ARQRAADQHGIAGEPGAPGNNVIADIGDGRHLVRLDAGDADRRARLPADEKAVAYDLWRGGQYARKFLDQRQEGRGGPQLLALRRRRLRGEEDRAGIVGQQQPRIAVRGLYRDVGDVADGALHEIDAEPADQRADEDEDEYADGDAQRQ